jgi:hypothetical protein
MAETPLTPKVGSYSPSAVENKPIVVNVEPSPKKWDLLDIVSKLMGIVLPVVLYLASASFNHQQVDLQSLEHRQSIDEENRGRVMERMFNLGDGSIATRLAAAKALRSYADMGRLDAVSIPGLLPYLKSECDPAVFALLKESVLVVAKNTAQANVAGQNQYPELLRGLGGIDRNSQCPSDAGSTPPSTSSLSTVIAAPPHYYEVGCGQTNSGILDVPVPATMQEIQKVQSVSASLVNTDNLKSQSVSIVHFDNTGAKVKYVLEGLDRQMFGNCPGGGHGTLVTNFVIGPR